MKKYSKFLVTLLALAGTVVNLNLAHGAVLTWIQSGIAAGNAILVYLVKNDSGNQSDLVLDGTTA